MALLRPQCVGQPAAGSSLDDARVAATGGRRSAKNILRPCAWFLALGLASVWPALGGEPAGGAPRFAAPSTTPGTTAARAGAAPLVDAHAVYAAFTLNLTRFVSWPSSAFAAPDTPLVIGTFPRDRINPALDEAIRGEMVNGHPLRAIRLQSLDDLAKCHVVFMSRGTARQAAVLERCAGRPILTVGDDDGFLALGGHVRFVPHGTQIRLSISAPHLKASGLAARSQLLRIAGAP